MDSTIIFCCGSKDRLSSSVVPNSAEIHKHPSFLPKGVAICWSCFNRYLASSLQKNECSGGGRNIRGLHLILFLIATGYPCTLVIEPLSIFKGRAPKKIWKFLMTYLVVYKALQKQYAAHLKGLVKLRNWMNFGNVPFSIKKFILQISGTLNRAFWAWNW